jgi:hypothetical protein
MILMFYYRPSNYDLSKKSVKVILFIALDVYLYSLKSNCLFLYSINALIRDEIDFFFMGDESSVVLYSSLQ